MATLRNTAISLLRLAGPPTSPKPYDTTPATSRPIDLLLTA